MTERKFKSYTLWMKWRDLGWRREMTCLNLPWPAANPIDVLKGMTKNYSPPLWIRGKNWMILPEDREPKRDRGGEG